jgi:hypothetical protein
VEAGRQFFAGIPLLGRNRKMSEERKDEGPVGEEEASFELGDIVYLSGRNGAWEITGRIYYIDESKIQILPADKAKNLETINIIDGDLDPDLEIENLYLITKRTNPAFVVQSNFQVNQLVDTIKEDGTLGPIFTITAIDAENDTATFKNEAGDFTTINFAFTGIPEEYSSEFVIMRSREAPIPVVELVNVEREGAAEGEEEEKNDEPLEVLGEIEIPESREVVVVPKTEQIIEDHIQYSDMFQDLLNCLPSWKQQNPKYIAEVRLLVELMMSLRNDVVKYTKSGEPQGLKPSIYTTLGQLLEKVSIPLSRAVLEADRVLYLDHTESHIKNLSIDERATRTEGVYLTFLSDMIKESNEYYENQIGKRKEGANAQLPNWYVDWEGFLQRYFSSWIPTGEGKQKPFLKDQEFFRAPLPEVIEKKKGDDMVLDFEEVVGGLPKNKDFTKDHVVATGAETLIGMSVLRGTSGRMGRLSPKEPPRLLESPERGGILSQVLFPLQFLREFGSIRSSKLAIDVATSMMKPLLMAKILKEKGGITDVPSAGSILAISASSLGNITLEDWLENQPLEAQGLGDIYGYLSSLGLSESELTLDQMSVLVSKINMFLANLRDTLVKINAESQKKLSELTLINNTFLSSEDSKKFIESLHAEFLNDQIELFRTRFPSYRENDVALFGFLMQKYTDYTLAVLSQGEFLAKEWVRLRRDNYREAVLRRQQLNKKKKLIGEIPKPNPCAHVRSLGIIRKVKDKTEYFKLLAKFITKFGSERKDNWLYCTLCNQECLCFHEMLLLQEFLRPREKDVLHKELLLAFSDGQFQGRYCCKNCGQPISDIEYDNSLEYDDDGRPMSGRSVLVDQDAVEEEQLKLFLDAPAETVEQIDFKTERQNLIYKTALQLADKVGIAFSREDLKKIVQRVEAELLRQPSVEEYSVKFKQAKAAGRTIPDYTTIIHRVLVCGTAAHLLICIQTNIPGYSVRYVMEGCKPGFGGYPYGEESDKTGIKYLACAVGSMMKNESPWNLTGFQKGAKDKREALIETYINALAGQGLNDMTIQEEIARKREHIETEFGEGVKEGKLVEQIPSNFLPPLLKASDAPKEPIVEAAATESQRIQAWLLQANAAAGSTGILDAKSVYSATTCCFTPLRDPGGFWKEIKTLPELPSSEKVSGPHGTHINVHFKAPRLEHFSVNASEKDYYKLFLQNCFTGPRKGMKHEPGYDHICPHCKFVFPKDPSLMDYEKEGKTALESQGVNTSKSEFEALVAAMNLNYKVEKLKKVQVSAGLELFMKLADIEPAPFDGWKALLYDAKEKITAIPGDKITDELEIATAYNMISNKAQEAYDELVKRMGKENAETLEKIVSQKTSSIIQSLHDYLMIPFLRLSNRFNINSLRIQKSYDLPSATEQDILTDLQEHFSYSNEIEKQKYIKGLTHAKVKYVSQQFSSLIPFLQKEIRAPLIPGGALGIPYIMKAAIYGILESFINPNDVPPTYSEFTSEAGSLGDVSSRANMKILYYLLKRFREEGIQFSPDQIREALAKRKESEKVRIITRLDGMSPEEKKLDLLQKRLGLGEWARGGTKGIAILNAEQYDYENWELFQMGATKRRGREPDRSGFMSGDAPAEGYETYDKSKDDD